VIGNSYKRYSHLVQTILGMGNPVSKLREDALQLSEDEKITLGERLQLLEKMVSARLDNQLRHILAGERSDQEIYTGTVVEHYKQVNIIESDKASQDLKAAVDEFFNKNYMEGLKKLVTVGMDQVLGNAYMGEYETQLMFPGRTMLYYDTMCTRTAGTSLAKAS